MDNYTEAHLFVAAIRILDNKIGGLPSLEDVCSLLDISVESAHAICRRLKKLGIIETAEDPFSLKLILKDHLEIEKIPRQQTEENSLAEEIEKFQKKQNNLNLEVAKIQKDLKEKRKDMFADIEKKFKKELGKYQND